MTDVSLTPPPAGMRAAGSDAGVDFEVTLDRAELLPGRLAVGSVRIAFQQDLQVRGILACLTATER